jgi:hypothetical protein
MISHRLLYSRRQWLFLYNELSFTSESSLRLKNEARVAVQGMKILLMLLVGAGLIV